MRFLTVEEVQQERRETSAERQARPLLAGTFLDKGLDAINGVGRLMEGFALTLDNVIGQAFDDWGTPKAAAARKKAALAGSERTPSTAEAPRARLPVADSVSSRRADDWGDFDMESEKENATVQLQKQKQQQTGKEQAAKEASAKGRLNTSLMSKLDAATSERQQICVFFFILSTLVYYL
jgi:hypothetical protein